MALLWSDVVRGPSIKKSTFLVLVGIAISLLSLHFQRAVAQVPPPVAVPTGMAKPAPVPVDFGPLGEPVMYGAQPDTFQSNELAWWAVAVSPDGKTAVTTHGHKGAPGEYRVWDLAAGTLLRTIPEPAGTRTAAFSPNGKYLVTGNYDGSIRVYAAANSAYLARADKATGGHTDGVNGLSFSADGTRLASAGLDNVAMVWDFTQVVGKVPIGGPIKFSPFATFKKHAMGVLSVALTADGKTLLTGSLDMSARIWDVPALPKAGEKPVVVEKEKFLLAGHKAAVEAVAVWADGSLFVTGSWDTQLIFWDAKGKNLGIATGFKAGVMAVALSKDGKSVAVGCGNVTTQNPGEIRVFDADTRKQLRTIDTPMTVLGLAFLPDNKTVVASGHDKVLHVWNGEKDRPITSPGGTYAPLPILTAEISKDGRYLAVSNEDLMIHVFDLTTKKAVRVCTGHADAVTGLAFSPDGKTLATASHDKTVKLWPLPSGEPKTLTGHTSWVLGVCFSPDGTTLATGGYDKTVRLWNVATGKNSATWNDHTAGVRTVAFAPNGKLLASAGSDRLVRIWDIAEGKVKFSLKGHKGAVRSIAFSPDGTMLASGSEDKSAKIWDALTGKELRTLDGHGDTVTAVRFSPNGHSLAAATFNGGVVLWDPSTGRKRGRLNGHQEAVTAVAYTAGGKQLITTGQDRQIHLWNPVAGVDATALKVFKPSPAVSTAAVSVDGRSATTGGFDGAVRFWDATTGEPKKVVELAHPGGVASVDWSANSKYALSVGVDGKVKLWDTAAGTVIKEYAGKAAAFVPNGKSVAIAAGATVSIRDLATGWTLKKLDGGMDAAIQRLCFSPDSSLVAVVGADRTVALWDVATAKKKGMAITFRGGEQVADLAFAPDGTTLAVAVNSADQPAAADDAEYRLVRWVVLLPTDDAKAWADPKSMLVHQERIVSVIWQTGGAGLLTASEDGAIRLWDRVGNRITRQFLAHASAVVTAVGRPESRVLLTVGDDRTIKRWTLPGASEPPLLTRLTPPGAGRIWAADYSADGKYLYAAGGGDRAFRVYASTLSGPSAVKIEETVSGVYASAYSPNGKTLATGHDDGSILLWDTTTGQRIGKLVRSTRRVWSLAFNPDGSTLIAVGGGYAHLGSPGEAVLWDVRSGTVRKTLTGHVGVLQTVAFNPDGKTIVAGDTEGTLRFWAADSGSLIRSVRGHSMGIRTLAYSLDGKVLVTGGYDNVVKVWDVETGEPTRTIPLVNFVARPTKVLVSPDGTEVVVCTRPNAPQPGQPENAVALIYSLVDPDALPRQLRGHTGAVLNAAFLGDRRTLVTAGGKIDALGEVKLWDFPSGKPVGEFRGLRSWVEALAVSPDGKSLATGGAGQGKVGDLRFWNAGGFVPISTTVHPDEKDYIAAAGLSPDGKTYITAGWRSGLAVWDTTNPISPVLRKSLAEHGTAGLRSVHFASDGKRFVTSDEKGAVKVWDTATLAVKVSFQASELEIYRAKFTPDGKAIVTCAGQWQNQKQGEIRVWSPETGKEMGRFPDQSREVWDVVFLNGGTIMVTAQAVQGGPDNAHLKVWDFATKQVKATPLPLAQFDGARSLAVNVDGTLLAVGSYSGKLKVFDTATWQETLGVPGLANVCFRLAFSPDTTTLAVASGDNATVLVRLPGKK